MCIIRQLMYKHSIIDCYPRLLDDEASIASAPPPDICESSVSSHEGSGRGAGGRSVIRSTSFMGAKMGTAKTSQDIMIFKVIAQRMPPKSLLHLLHGAQQSNDDPTCSMSSRDVPSLHSQPQSSTRSKNARIRFAQDERGHVKCDVYEIPRSTDKELWWQAEECHNIKKGCKSLAEHFLHYQEDYIKAVKRLMDKGCTDTKKIEKAMECVVRHTICRGLESHIVRNCRKACKAQRKAVMQAQAEMRWSSCDLSRNDGKERIRRAARKASMGSRILAAKLARLDAFQSLGVRWDSSQLLMMETN